MGEEKLLSFAYEYDGNGNRIKKEDSQGETSYHYNEKNQLISEEGIRGQKFFTYNRQGSIIREDGWTKVNRYAPESLRYEMKGRSRIRTSIMHLEKNLRPRKVLLTESGIQDSSMMG